MEISSIEALTNTKLKVDRALDTTNKTLHRLLEPIPFESEAVTKATELNSIKDKRVYAEMYESEADARIISGKWVLKPQKARYVLRAFEEDVKDEDVFASTTMTASVLSSDRPQKRRSHSIHSRRENRLPQRTHGRL